MASAEGFLHVHHLGGRDGTVSFPMVPNFAGDLKVFAYEADVDSIEQIKALSKNDTLASQSVLPYAISEQDGDEILYLNYDPFTSSLLAKNTDFVQNTDLCNSNFTQGNFSQGDYLFNDVLEPVETRRLAVRTLDSLRADGEPRIDFLAMDIQGGELKALKGASHVLECEIVGLNLEAAMVPCYQGHPLLGDIHTFLAEKGFQFCQFWPHFNWTWYRSPIGWRGADSPVFCDVLYLQSPQNVAEKHANPGLSLAKLAATALLYYKFEYIAEAVRIFLERGYSFDDLPQERTYCRMFVDLAAAYQEDEGFVPPRFPQLFSQTDSFARFNPTTDYRTGKLYSTRAACQAYFAQVDIKAWATSVVAGLSETPVGLERVCVQYGFTRSAALARSQRMDHIKAMLTSLGLPIPKNEFDLEIAVRKKLT